MPSSELSYDSYRIHRLNDQDQISGSSPSTSRLRNVAKVEPYSINTNMVRPLYQSSVSSSPLKPSTKIIPAPAATSTTTTQAFQQRAGLNSVANPSAPASISSSAAPVSGLIRHPNVRQSDFLVPNPTYSTATPTQTVSQRAQSLSNSSSYATPPKTMTLSESLSQIEPQRSTNNHAYYPGQSKGLVPSINDFPQKPRPLSTQADFRGNKVMIYHCLVVRLSSSSSPHIHLRNISRRMVHPLGRTVINWRNSIIMDHPSHIIIDCEIFLRHQQMPLILHRLMIEKELKAQCIRSWPIVISINNNNNISNYRMHNK